MCFLLSVYNGCSVRRLIRTPIKVALKLSCDLLNFIAIECVYSFTCREFYRCVNARSNYVFFVELNILIYIVHVQVSK